MKDWIDFLAELAGRWTHSSNIFLKESLIFWKQNSHISIFTLYQVKFSKILTNFYYNNIFLPIRYDRRRENWERLDSLLTNSYKTASVYLLFRYSLMMMECRLLTQITCIIELLIAKYNWMPIHIKYSKKM